MKLLRQSVNNQSGAMTLVVVVMTSICMITLLSTTYIYTVNRAKYHSRIRQAYAMQNVMEEAAKRMRQFYDNDPTSGGWPTANECGPARSLKVTGPDGKTYCFGLNETKSPTGETMYALNSKITLDGALSLPGHFSYVEKFVARMDRFFDETKPHNRSMQGEDPRAYFKKPTMIGWMFNPNEAVAAQSESDYRGSINKITEEGGLGGKGGTGIGIIGGGGRQLPTPNPGGGGGKGCDCAAGTDGECFIASGSMGKGGSCAGMEGTSISYNCLAGSLHSSSQCSSYAGLVETNVGKLGSCTLGSRTGEAACLQICEQIPGCMARSSPTPNPSPTPIAIDPGGWGSSMNVCKDLTISNCVATPKASSCTLGCARCPVGAQDCASISMDIQTLEGKSVWTSTQAFKFVKPGDFRSR